MPVENDASARSADPCREVPAHPSFNEFVATIAKLRAPDGCPWDREQTHESIAPNMVEEAYEAVDAIESGDFRHVREELGDVLLQVVLQSQIAADAGEFTIDDVCADVNEKMIRRHPHVFGEARADNAAEVLDLWDQVKLAEKAATDLEADDAQEGHAGLLDGVPSSFPGLMQAQKLSRKAAAAGFEWETVEAVWDKVAEEVSELKEAYAAAPKAANGKVDVGSSLPGVDADARARSDEAVEMELGDVLFSLVNVARKMGMNAEGSLRASCRKFRRRWSAMEEFAWEQGRDIEDLTSGELEGLWEKAKAQED